MKLQIRIVLVPFVVVSILSIVLYVLISKLTINSFNYLEAEILQRQVERVNNSFSNLVDEHANKIIDWAQWDKTYDFMQSLSESYIEENLNALTMNALGFSSALYFTPDLDLKYGVTVTGDSVKSAEVAIVEQIKDIFLRTNSQSFRGLIRLGGEVFMLAASPILPNKGDRSSRGILVTISKVNQSVLKLVQHLTNLQVKFWSDGESNIDAGVIKPISSELIYAFGEVKDLTGNSILHFRVEDSRSIVASGVKVRRLSIAAISVTGGCSILLLIIVINVFAAKRIKRFSAQVRAIAKEGNSSGRLTDTMQSSRSLRYKTAGGVFLVFLTATVITILVFKNYMLKGFQEIENQVMIDNLERAKRALTGRLEKIKSKVIDWAQWDDTYQFVEDRNQAYSEANLGFDTLGPMKMKYVLYFDNTSQLKEGREVENESVVAIDPVVAASFAAVESISRAKMPTAGFVALPKSVVAVASSPVLDTGRSLPSRGSMIFATLIDDTLAAEIGRQTRLKLSLSQSKSKNKGQNWLINRVSESEIQGNYVIYDLVNRPALNVNVKSTREIYQSGLVTIRLLPIYVIFAGLFSAVITVFWVDRILLARIRKMGQELIAIKETGETSTKITQNGADEISGLAEDINSMLASIEKVQKELKKARSIAEAANAAKSIFISRVSHELRTPIAGIMGINRMIRKQENLSKGMRELLEMENVSAQGLLSVIDEILDFSKAEKGELSFEKISFDLRQVVRETMQTIAGRLESKYSSEDSEKVQLVCDIHSQVPEKLIGDPTRLKQILVNLLGNSVKFTQKGYVGLKIEIKEFDSEKTTIVFEVWDTGIGVSEDKLTTIFEPFKQADETVTKKYQGSGLGLFIVKQFVEKQGGEILVKSQVNKGTVFTVSIPFGSAQKKEKFVLNLVKPVFLAQTSIVASTIIKNLSEYGLGIEHLDPLQIKDFSPFESKLMEADLLVVSEEIFSLSQVTDKIEKRVKTKIGCTVAMLSPFSINLRDQLYEKGFIHVLQTPILVDDIIYACLGKTPQQIIESEDFEENVLNFKQKLNILVVDDVPTNRMILEDMLKDGGHQVTSAGDGTEMLELLTPMINGEADAKSFDIVLTDVSMPIMDGDVATCKIRELEKESATGIHISIIAVTAHTLKDEQEKIRASGVDGVLVKPMDPNKVAAEFRRILSSEMLNGGICLN